MTNKPNPEPPSAIREPKHWRDGEPCDHPGCLSHVSHPCEGCGRIAGRAASPPAKQERPVGYPRPCGLCPQNIESEADLEWHGLGNCVPLCSRCLGSGVDPKDELKITPDEEKELETLSKRTKFIQSDASQRQGKGLEAQLNAIAPYLEGVHNAHTRAVHIVSAIQHELAAPAGLEATLRGLVREMDYSADTLIALGSKGEGKSLKLWADKLEAALNGVAGKDGGSK